MPSIEISLGQAQILARGESITIAPTPRHTYVVWTGGGKEVWILTDGRIDGDRLRGDAEQIYPRQGVRHVSKDTYFFTEDRAGRTKYVEIA